MNTDRDAAPAAEGADTIRSRAFEFAVYTMEGEFPDEMEDVIRRAVTIGVDYGLGDAARPAPPAAHREGDEDAEGDTDDNWTVTIAERESFERIAAEIAARPAPATPSREGGVVAAVLGELEWRHWSTRDGSERMCLLCERDESRGHAPECRMVAAREAARGEG